MQFESFETNESSGNRVLISRSEKYSKNVCIWGGEAPFPNNVMHMWAYSDLAQRASIRAELAKDPDWRAFLAKAGGDLVEMPSIVLTPTNYSPLQ